MTRYIYCVLVYSMQAQLLVTLTQKILHMMSPIRLKNHITHKSGEQKTICVTAVLTALGIDVNSFHYTGSLADNRRNAILNRNGFACRSRLSKIGKNC